jgi:hypothetical protein
VIAAHLVDLIASCTMSEGYRAPQAPPEPDEIYDESAQVYVPVKKTQVARRGKARPKRRKPIQWSPSIGARMSVESALEREGCCTAGDIQRSMRARDIKRSMHHLMRVLHWLTVKGRVKMTRLDTKRDVDRAGGCILWELSK